MGRVPLRRGVLKRGLPARERKAFKFVNVISPGGVPPWKQHACSFDCAHVQIHEASADYRQALEEEARLCPKPPPLSSFLKEALAFKRPLRVAFPCCGLDSGEALHAMGVSFEAEAWDLEHGYKDALASLHGAHGALSSRVHAGKIEGDICRVPPESLAPFDLLLGGPPCQPFSGEGLKGGVADDRSGSVSCFMAPLVIQRPISIICKQGASPCERGLSSTALADRIPHLCNRQALSGRRGMQCIGPTLKAVCKLAWVDAMHKRFQNADMPHRM